MHETKPEVPLSPNGNARAEIVRVLLPSNKKKQPRTSTALASVNGKREVCRKVEQSSVLRTSGDKDALRRWATQLASNHRTALPPVIHTHEDLGNLMAMMWGEYVAGHIQQGMFRDFCVWAALFLQNSALQKGVPIRPLLVDRR